MYGDVQERLTTWAVMKISADENPKFLLSGGKTEIAEQRMENLNEAANRLFELQGQPHLPKPLQRWINAHKDLGCQECWSHASKPKHPKCAIKIDEYFEAEKELLKSIQS